jgi:hypothetical protein
VSEPLNASIGDRVVHYRTSPKASVTKITIGPLSYQGPPARRQGPNGLF